MHGPRYLSDDGFFPCEVAQSPKGRRLTLRISRERVGAQPTRGGVLMHRHLTYANVMVTLLAIGALTGGVAYAANTVFSSDVVNGEVKTRGPRRQRGPNRARSRTAR